MVPLFEKCVVWGGGKMQRHCSVVCAKIDEALAMLQEMRDHGVVPDITVYTILIDGLCEAGQLEEAVDVFCFLLDRGLQPDQHVYTVLIKEFVRRGVQIMHSWRTTDVLQMIAATIQSLKGYLYCNNVKKALEFLSIMTAKGFAADAHTKSLFIDLLSSQNVHDVDKALLRKVMHGGIKKMLYILSCLCVLCWKDFRQGNELTVIASDGIWDALLSDAAANACRGLPADLAAKLVQKRSNRTDKSPNKLSAVGSVEELFEEGSIVPAERMLDLQYEEEGGHLASKLLVFISIPFFPFLFAISIPISSCFIARNCYFNVDYYSINANAMRDRSPNDDPQVCQTTMQGFSKLDHVLSVFHRMNSLGPSPSVIDFNQLFTAMSKIKPFRLYSTILPLSRNLELSGILPNHCSIGILTTCYCHLGRVDLGLSLLAKRLKLGFPLVVISTTLINGLIHNDRLDQTIKLLDKVVKHGIQPSRATYGATVEALDVQTYNVLIDMLCEEGRVDEAQAILELMINRSKPPNIIAYTALLDGYCLRGQMDEAMELMEVMARNGCNPDVVTFSTLINEFCKSTRID
ncbi:LOW QUALITY PROTEIN: hypothetical protein Cgig2_018055 [Carnegiea gigantea]|uniref:Pentatricopeptide repeat-containing protein n=1 Tax=Carnegiea gigantea TaxID=171969 RepID=A0A9Q1JIC2_9CARY|nr:LOW QUALITY PROTEIN: hypothetical protein Cgig2_018055 [Carnegiea gigantea]